MAAASLRCQADPAPAFRRTRVLSLSFLVVAAFQVTSLVFVTPVIGAAGRLGAASSSVQRSSRLPRAAIKLDELEVGQKYTGTVLNTAPFGAFIEFGAERNGLVHISCLADGFVDNVNDVVQSGDEVEVWVKSVDAYSGKIGLTMVESKLSGGGGPRPRADLTPFQDLIGGDKIPGTVKSIQGFGCFVEVEASGEVAQGLVHVSEMSDDYVEDPWSVVTEGDAVEVMIKDVDMGAGKLSLSMKSEFGGGGGGRAPADLTPFQDLIGGDKIKGTVKSIQGFGCFVEVEAGGEVAQGLVHVSEMSDDFVDDPYSVVSEGDEVEVSIKDVDMDQGKLSLSMKSGEYGEE